MKVIAALSVWQPWAWLIANGHKDVENRGWAPNDDRIGSRFAIHASKRRVTKEEYEEFLKIVQEKGIKRFPKSIDEFDYGAILATAVLHAVSRNSKSYWAQRGAWHWKLISVKKLKPRKIRRGFQSWFSVKI